jgi:hypothetical protein
MSLISQIAKSMYIRRGQFGPIPLMGDPNSFHIYEPGPRWPEEHNSWNNLSQESKSVWLADAEIWLSNLQEKSPLTHSYLSNNFTNDTSLDTL